MPNPRFLQTAGRWMNKELPERITTVRSGGAGLGEFAVFSIDDILKGTTFYSNEQKDGKYIGLPIALEQALEHAGSNGIVATMPELIAAKVKADKSHKFWKKWYTTHTEENVGVDKKGRFYSKNEPVLVVVNGEGILTPDRIRKAYSDGLVGHSAKYTDDEFNGLLDGKLPGGNSIDIYPYEDIEKGVSDLPHQFGVVMPYKKAKGTKSGYHQKKPFLENPLVLARTAGSHDYLESFYEKAKASDGDLGNYHPFSGRDATIPQGRVLFVNNTNNGLNGNKNLNNNGRFVGIVKLRLGHFIFLYFFSY